MNNMSYIYSDSRPITAATQTTDKETARQMAREYAQWVDYKTFDAELIVIKVTDCIAFLQHISNIVLILKTKELHKPLYYTLLHLSLCDVCVLLCKTSETFLPRPHTLLVSKIALIVGCASLLSLVLISIDRLTAARGHLRYPDIVTNSRLVVALLFIWVISVLAFILPVSLIEGKAYIEWVRGINFAFGTVVGILLVVFVFIIRHVKGALCRRRSRRHTNSIPRRQLSDVMERLNTAVLELSQLNISISVILLLRSVVYVVWRYGGDLRVSMVAGNLRQLVDGAFSLSSPFIYASTMNELKDRYIHLYGRNVNRVHPTSRRRATDVRFENSHHGEEPRVRFDLSFET